MNGYRTRSVSLFASLLGFALSGAAATAQITGPIAVPQEASPEPTSPKPMRMRVASNVPKATSQAPPVYPPAAVDQGIEGDVVLHIIIGTHGVVRESSTMSGPALLIQSAIDAARKWQYQPIRIRINGGVSGVEQDTTVTINYVLGPPPTVTVNSKPRSAFSPEESTLRRKLHPPLPAVDADTAEDIRRLLAATGMKNVITTFFGSHLVGMRATIYENLPASVDREKVVNRFQEELQNRLNSGQVLDVVIPIYAKHFTHEEIKSFLAFYESPAGKRYAQEAPSLMWEVSDAGAPYWMDTVLPEIFQQMAQEYPELRTMK